MRLRRFCEEKRLGSGNSSINVCFSKNRTAAVARRNTFSLLPFEVEIVQPFRLVAHQRTAGALLTVGPDLNQEASNPLCLFFGDIARSIRHLEQAAETQYETSSFPDQLKSIRIVNCLPARAEFYLVPSQRTDVITFLAIAALGTMANSSVW